MKKFILRILMLAIVLPGLPGHWILSARKVHAAVLQPIKPGHSQIDQLLNLPKGWLFRDYTKIYLKNTTPNTALQKPDFVRKITYVAGEYIQTIYNFIPANQISIRGPPPDWTESSQLQPSPLLSTLR